LLFLQQFFTEEFDEDLSLFQSERILEFFVANLGPTVYNQAIGDARKFMVDKLDDLDAEFYVPEPDA
jgi:uncharacterized protein (DUF2164 family)